MIVNNIENAIIYSEVYSILDIMDEKDVKRLPMKCLELIEKKKSSSYNPKYDSNKPLKDQNVKQETLAFLALLYLNYWCDSEEEKNDLKKLFNENEINYQEELREKYNSDNLFKKSIDRNEKETTKETSIIVYRETVIQKLLNKLRKIFHFK